MHKPIISSFVLTSILQKPQPLLAHGCKRLETSVLRPAAKVPISKCFNLANLHVGDCVELVLKPAAAEVMRARLTMVVGARKRMRMRAFSGVSLMAGMRGGHGFHLMVEIEVIVLW
jgi:hypothetical protein